MIMQTIVSNSDEYDDAVEEASLRGMIYHTCDGYELPKEKIRLTFYDKISTQN